MRSYEALSIYVRKWGVSYAGSCSRPGYSALTAGISSLVAAVGGWAKTGHAILIVAAWAFVLVGGLFGMAWAAAYASDYFDDRGKSDAAAFVGCGTMIVGIIALWIIAYFVLP